jgi:hypothetical protein
VIGVPWDYEGVARQDPHTVGIGGALVSVVDPHFGQEAAYNAWYEQDHYYAGALAMPWIFAGQRFVATGELLAGQRRNPREFPEHVHRCTYLHVYWVSVAHLDDHIAWTAAANQVLRATPGRIFADRQHVFTGFHLFLRDLPTPRSPVLAHQCLDYPFDGMIIEALEPRAGASELDPADVDNYVARIQSVAGVAHSIVLGQYAGLSAPPRSRRRPGNPAWTTLLHFVAGDVRTAWRSVDAGCGRDALTGAARVMFAGGFTTLIPGRHTYLDNLDEPSI